MANKQTSLAKRLKDARLEAGLTQRKLGLAIGINIEGAQVRINQYESGTNTPKFETVNKIAEVLKLPTAYFYENDKTISQIILNLAKINSRNRKIILEQTEKLAEK